MEKGHKEHIMVKAQSQKKEEACHVSTTLAATDLHRPSLQPPKPKFLSLSLPNSANSSPSTLMEKKPKHRSIESPCQASTLIHQQQQTLIPLDEVDYMDQMQDDQLQDMQLRRSKSCGEGRASCAPSDEFDLWWAKPGAVERNNMHRNSFSKTEAILVSGKNVETCEDEGFKCTALCMYLPGFGKAKAVKTRKELGSEVEGCAVISRTVSLEKFECGSWASSALFHEINIEGDPINSSYFDLPLELIKCSANDVHSPVTSAFVFEKDLKTGFSTKSPRHVRFSTPSKPASPASCITPRLRKAREDFTAFLEAQSA
ncbi:hypothetical protein JHK82_044541 [Glycine max]|nr:hypothetical protein JHK82_044541 [Glycine max]KAH1205534.1 hypothetical protein GmHk_16G046213 [Glycine max]